MYAEANEGSKGDNASIISPAFVSQAGQSIEFFYHIYSASPFDHRPGALQVCTTTRTLCSLTETCFSVNCLEEH